MRVAIIHYWLVGMRGGENVLEEIIECYPDADIYTHVYDPRSVSDLIRSRNVTETFVGRLPGARRHYQKYLGFMPRALEELDLRGYDLVISSESGPAKGVLAPPGATHVCYCHTPMRYIYDHYVDYRDELSLPARLYFSRVAHRLRTWDAISAMRVDAFAANSSFVASRIRRVYGRDAAVIAPPVATERYTPGEGPRADYYLVVSELVRYKRVDLALEAARAAGVTLKIVGDGEQFDALAAAAPANVELLGRVPGERLQELYRSARALLFPGEEDFGIVPVEAMASGCPVIALRRGGAIDYVVDGVTGVFFDEQSASGLRAALTRFEALNFDAAAISAHAATFGRPQFRAQFSRFVDDAVAAVQARDAARLNRGR